MTRWIIAGLCFTAAAAAQAPPAAAPAPGRGGGGFSQPPPSDWNNEVYFRNIWLRNW